jgi:Ca2+-binding RTX toxin-like protein
MPVPVSPLKIMPMGDSITAGTVAGGYRAPLYALLTADGYSVSYVGDQTTTSGGGLPADQDNHEGLPGNTSAQVWAQIDASGIVQSSMPNAVLLLVGTNDIGEGASFAETDSNIAALMDDIISSDPAVHIFLSTVLHRADDGTGWVTAFNATLPSIVAPRADHVTLVDTASALTLSDLDPGGLHPLLSGYDKLASVWYRALEFYYGTPTPGLSVQDLTTNQALPPIGRPYSGPFAGPSNDYISVTPDNLDVVASTPGWFIHGGNGNDTIVVSSGTNVLDAGAGSNFLVGGSGQDSFYIDDRSPASSAWSTIANFHAGDTATIWGLTPASFTAVWLANQGVQGATGLTGVFAPNVAGRPTVSITLAGYTPAALTNGALSFAYGTTPSQPGAPELDYLMIHAN